MAEIHKLTKNGETIIPATTTDAVVHPELQTPLTSLINEYNVSTLFPTSGIDGTNKYDLQTAINLLDEKLAPEQKTVGIKVAFYTKSDELEKWEYVRVDGLFSNINYWNQCNNEITFDEDKTITVHSGTRSTIIYIHHSIKSKGRLYFHVDQSNFPVDISYNGTQIRDHTNLEIATQGGEYFELSGFDTLYFTIGCYFKTEVQNDIEIPINIKYYYPSISNMYNSIIEQNNYIPLQASFISYDLSNTWLGIAANKYIVFTDNLSKLIPAKNIKKLCIEPKENTTTNIIFLKNPNIINGNKLDLIDDGSSIIKINTTITLDVPDTCDFIGINCIVGDDLSNVEPKFIGVEFKQNPNIPIKVLKEEGDYTEIIEDAFLASKTWWETEETKGCKLLKIDIQNLGVTHMSVLNNSSTSSVIAVLKDEPIRENNQPLPFATGYTERILSVDNRKVNEYTIPLDAKFLFVDYINNSGNSILPEIKLFSTTINLEKAVKNFPIYNIGEETVTTKYENFENFNIIGINSILSIIEDNSGDYSNPPIEISGGKLLNICVRQTGKANTEHPGYCVHSDSNNNVDNEIIVKDCIFESSSNACWGVGTRINYKMTFVNCLFISKVKNTDPINNTYSGVGRCWYSHNTSYSGPLQKEEKSIVTFINCHFISEDTPPVYLQEWSSSDTPTNIDYCEFVFINNTFSWNGDIEDAITIDYKSGTQELNSKEFKRHFILSEKSTNNNVSWLNKK